MPPLTIFQLIVAVVCVMDDDVNPVGALHTVAVVNCVLA